MYILLVSNMSMFILWSCPDVVSVCISLSAASTYNGVLSYNVLRVSAKYGTMFTVILHDAESLYSFYVSIYLTHASSLLVSKCKPVQSRFCVILTFIRLFDVIIVSR